MKRILLLLLGICLFLSLPAQSKKERKKCKIKSSTEWETLTEKGVTKTFKTLYEEYDRAGRVVLHTEYATDGSILLKQTCAYDAYGNKTEETEFDLAKKKNEKRTFKYNALKDKTEEVEYSPSGSVLKRTAFTYDAAGNKTTETTFDGQGKLIKKSTFTYNSKGLKTGKKSTVTNNPSESSKKWDYVYY